MSLFTIETEHVRLTWSGPASGAMGEEPLRIVEATGPVRLDGGLMSEAAVWLTEETAYTVLVQSLGEAPVRLVHRDPVVTAGLVSADRGHVLHGRVGFGSQAGRTRFEVRAGSTVVLAFDVSVLPTKLGEADVAAMRAEVEAAAAGLSVAALRPTVLTDAGRSGVTTPPVWLAALRGGLDELTGALREIDRRPVLDVQRTVEAIRPSAMRRPAPETRRAVQQSGILAERLPARPARLTADTPAHRWLAERLHRIHRRLLHLRRDEGQRRTSARRQALLAELERLAQRVRQLRVLSVMRYAGARAPEMPPLMLRRRPAYASAYHALRQLDHGLALRPGALDVATQDLAVLYETWAALAVADAVADALGVEAPTRPFGIDIRGADVRLRKGRAHAVRLGNDAARVEIVYTPRFPAPPALLPQRPDLLLTIQRGGVTKRVVLDAKYRRDDSVAYRRRHGVAGPPEDALNTLHRYRDAIPGEVAIAAALFPGPPDAVFTTSRLWTSLDALGVGAIPLRPGAREALAAFIGGLVR